MDTQQQTSRRTCSRIEPHRLHHDARGRRKSQFGRMRLLRNAGPQRDMVEAGYIDPSQARACINGAGGCNLEREVAALAASDPKPQSIMMIEQGLQRAEELILPQARRDLQHQRLVEAVDRTSPFGQPAHDRCRRQRPGRHVRLARRRLRGRHHSRGQRPRRLMFKHRPRRDHQALLARTAHQQDRQDAVAAQREEAVVDADTLQPEHLGEQAAQHLLLRRTRRTPLRRRRLRRRQGPSIDLAARRQWQTLEHHECRRHHVIRQTRADMRAQRRGIEHLVRSPHHIGDQPLAARRSSRTTTAACATCRDGAAAPPRSRPARSGNRAASPDRPHGPGTPAPRPAASAPGPRSGTSAPPQPRTDWPRTAPPSAPPGPDSHAPAPLRRRTAHPQPPPAPAPGPRPARRPA